MNNRERRELRAKLRKLPPDEAVFAYEFFIMLETTRGR
jgi:hypothetical protein